MHKLTPPVTDCLKCGAEDSFIVPRYQAMVGGADGVTGVMIWDCLICGFELNTKPLDDEAPPNVTGA